MALASEVVHMEIGSSAIVELVAARIEASIQRLRPCGRSSAPH